MFSKFAHFFIKNSKLTLVLIIITILSGVGSYFMIPKQYNPTIVVPAFHIFLSSPNLSSDENQRFVLNELENKVGEIEGIDEIFGVAGDNYVSLMAKFHVGQNSEEAKTRLGQKLSGNADLKPLGVEDPIIKAINPDELPQITYTISYKEQNSNLSDMEKQIYLKQIANLIKEKLKVIPNTTTLDIVGGIPNNLIINLDIEKIESMGVDILGIYDILQKNNFSLPNGSFSLQSGERVFLDTSGKLSNISDIEKIIIGNFNETNIYLGDVATFSHGVKKLSSYIFHSEAKSIGSESILIGVGKQVGTNGVFVVNDIKKAMEEIQKTLPKNIQIQIIQDEGAEASHATSELIMDLILSIIIVVIILVIFLGGKNALNTATSIPLVLSLVFLYSYIVGFDINRISLFALILVIGMLVDDSIVVVENIHRHLEERVNNKKTKLDAILDAVQEVGSGVVLSTITKILAFAGMFAVTGMMGEYMGPIPMFAIIALTFSIIVAFGVNPWVSYLTTKDVEHKDISKQPKKIKKSSFDIRKYYLTFMEKYLQDNKGALKKRKRFKTTFWISLVLIMILPIYFGIFKARMLPKSNKDQIYVWIDGSRGDNVEKMKEIEKDLQKFFLENDSLPKKLQITKSLTSSIGTPFMGDFANLFRGGLERGDEYQISSRVNLISKDENKKRLKSEDFTIQIRPLLREYLLKKYPDLTIRVLEDPPGPPVRATFMIKLKGGENSQDLENFTNDIYKEVLKVEQKYNLVDLGNSLPSTYRKINIVLDNELVSKSGLSSSQIAYTLGIAKNGLPLNVISNKDSLEATNLILSVENSTSEDIDLLKKITFTNSLGQKIPLESIAKLEYTFVSPNIQTDGKRATQFIYSEIGDGSVVYPIVHLMFALTNRDFLQQKYEVLSSGFYGIQYKSLETGKIYSLEWDGEWKLTMDTFRDLGLAMMIAILGIYFLMVANFGSFGVGGIIMLPFLLGFFGIFPGFTLLYLLKNEYFNATGMIGVISLAGIVVGNSILLIDYINILKKRGWTIEKAVLQAGYIRFMPIMLTSIAAIFGAIKIVGDPVWSGLAWSIVFGLGVSAILTLITIPIFYYDSQKKIWDKDMENLKNAE